MSFAKDPRLPAALDKICLLHNEAVDRKDIDSEKTDEDKVDAGVKGMKTPCVINGLIDESRKHHLKCRSRKRYYLGKREEHQDE